MTQDFEKVKRVRQLYLGSIILFVVFCVLPGVGQLSEPRTQGVFSVTNLISYVAGIFAWVLMCSAYQLRGKMSAESTQSEK